MQRTSPRATPLVLGGAFALAAACLLLVLVPVRPGPPAEEVVTLPPGR